MSELVFDKDGNAVDPDTGLAPNYQPELGVEPEPADPDDLIDPSAPATDTPADPAEDPTADPTPAPVDMDAVNKAYEEHGLGRQFDGPVDALSRIPDFNRYTDALKKAGDASRLENERLQARLNELENSRSKQPPPSAEDFQDQFEADPRAALIAQGFVPIEEHNKLRSDMDKVMGQFERDSIASVLNDYDGLKSVVSTIRLGDIPRPGLNAVWDEMDKMAATLPGIEHAPFETRIALLHPRALATVKARQKPPVKPVGTNQKLEANTTGAGSSSGQQPAGLDFGKMSVEQMEKLYKEKGLWT